jgi:hypothetical protein
MIVTRESAKHVGFDIKGATVASRGSATSGRVAPSCSRSSARNRRRHRLEGRRLQREGGSTSRS